MIESEWVTISTTAGPMSMYSCRPSSASGRAVVILQTAFGVDRPLQSTTQDFAERGYLAVAPQLFHRSGIRSLPHQQHAAAVRLVDATGPDDIITDLRAVVAHLRREGIEPDRIALVGFCFGGRAAFTAATAIAGLAATVVFYGPGIVAGPHAVLDRVAALDTALLIHVGAEDPLIPADQIHALDTALREAGVDFRHHLYPDAGHAFASGARRELYRPAQAEAAWRRTHEFLELHLPIDIRADP
ncbi:dienelactone hydrolase family protein [Nocardia sp. NPDC003963]